MGALRRAFVALAVLPVEVGVDDPQVAVDGDVGCAPGLDFSDAADDGGFAVECAGKGAE